MFKTRFLRSIIFSVLLLSGSASFVHARQTDSLYNFEDLDSLSIFELIDSILALETKYSLLNIRLSYTSKVTSAGRDLNIKQYGFTPGLSFYHHSGVYADVSGYWNSQLTPKYSLTVATAGFLAAPTDWFSYNISAERSFYSAAGQDSTITAPPNGLNGTIFFDADWLYTSVDYTYLFGNGAAHRLQGSVNGSYAFKKILFLDKITLLPGISALFGNADIVSYRFTVDVTDPRVRQLLRRNPRLRNRSLTLESENVFGLMNVSFSAPVSLRYKNFSLLLSYTYNIPIELPGEVLADASPNSYFSASLGYMIPIRQSPGL